MTLTRNGYLGTAAAMTVISWIAQSSNDNLTFGGFIAALHGRNFRTAHLPNV